MYIDFHTHAFADKIAQKAMSALTATSGLAPCTDGTASGLIRRMKKSGVDRAVLLPIATKPSQHEVVNNWAARINGSDGIYAFGSVYPDSPDAVEYVEKIRDMGLFGIKLHPDYQEFFVEDPKAYPVYRKCQELGFPILFHCGFDPLSPSLIHCTPEGILKVHEQFPRLTMILAHMGGMYRWEGVERLIAGVEGEVYLDLSMTPGEAGDRLISRIVAKHGADRILFGSDCPWDDPANCIELIKRLPLSDRERDMIFSENALRLLNPEN